MKGLEKQIMCNFNEYKIIKADIRQWATYHAIYRLSQLNEWMPLTFKGEIERYIKSDFAYWVVKNNRKIGGALIKPNMLKCVFTIEPFEDKEELSRALIYHTQKISDMNKEIVVPNVDLSLVNLYKSHGFLKERGEKLMICPTGKYNVDFGDEFSYSIPETKHKKEMTQLYYDTYSKSNVPLIAAQSYQFQMNSVDIFFNHVKAMNVPKRWSSLIYHKADNKLVSACTVGLINGFPYILDLVVHPHFQRNGLARKMIMRLLNLANYEYEAVRLCVDTNNDAQLFYKEMGFIGLGETAYMVKRTSDNI